MIRTGKWGSPGAYLRGEGSAGA